MNKTDIQWCDLTWNPVSGCSKASEGCRNCYAERIASRFWGARKFTDVQCHPDRLEEPLRNKKPAKIFVNSMSDLFHPDVPDDFIWKVFAVMALARQHHFMILTKRPERMNKVLLHWKISRAAYDLEQKHGLPVRNFEGWPIPNVWLGVSVENQEAADERIPLLLQTPAAVRFVSCEPLLGPVDLNQIAVPNSRNMELHMSALHEQHDDCYYCSPAQLDWVIAGGETGPNARPVHPSRVRILRDQCQEAEVPFFFKSWGEYLPDNQNPNIRIGQDWQGTKVGPKRSGNLLDGQKWEEFPEEAVS